MLEEFVNQILLWVLLPAASMFVIGFALHIKFIGAKKPSEGGD